MIKISINQKQPHYKINDYDLDEWGVDAYLNPVMTDEEVKANNTRLAAYPTYTVPCKVCKFLAPLNKDGICGWCEHEAIRQAAAFDEIQKAISNLTPPTCKVCDSTKDINSYGLCPRCTQLATDTLVSQYPTPNDDASDTTVACDRCKKAFDTADKDPDADIEDAVWCPDCRHKADNGLCKICGDRVHLRDIWVCKDCLDNAIDLYFDYKLNG